MMGNSACSVLILSGTSVLLSSSILYSPLVLFLLLINEPPCDFRQQPKQVKKKVLTVSDKPKRNTERAPNPV